MLGSWSGAPKAGDREGLPCLHPQPRCAPRLPPSCARVLGAPTASPFLRAASCALGCADFSDLPAQAVQRKAKRVRTPESSVDVSYNPSISDISQDHEVSDSEETDMEDGELDDEDEEDVEYSGDNDVLDESSDCSDVGMDEEEAVVHKRAAVRLCDGAPPPLHPSARLLRLLC